MDSEDSDFYGTETNPCNLFSLLKALTNGVIGDEEVVAGLQARVDDFDVEAWHALHDINPGRPRPRGAHLASAAASFHNPYAGVSFAWQLSETVDAFLKRLPPRTTEQTPETPWIFICNPYIARQAKIKDEIEGGDAEKGRGNENEAPSEEGSKVGLVVEAGMERLELLNKFVEKTRSLAKNKTAAEKDMNKERKQAAADILALAHAAKVRAGKVSQTLNSDTNGRMLVLLTLPFIVDALLLAPRRQ